MKRMLLCLCLALALFVSAAAAETMGFGFVNSTDVALRRGVGGKVITRLPLDTCVWICDSATDSRGLLWYEVRAGLHVNHANYDYYGWMRADFIDAGDEVWHDVTAIAAASHGLVALRTDGSVVTAGQPIVSRDGLGWVSPRNWAVGFPPAARVGIPHTGNEYFLVTADGLFFDSGNQQGLADGHARADRLEAVEELLQEEAVPTWQRSGEAVTFSAVGVWDATTSSPRALCVGVRADGSVLAEPDWLADRLASWGDLKDLRIWDSCVLGLRRDGTVLCMSIGDGFVPDVSAWREIVAIGLGRDWCVGLRSDGTLVFAGEHIFMNEGHVRK